uniref:Lytic transglycosylase domain-containing protein n=1 Tax=candidate division WOR-3 bacterium TaxID=2052148 RepID=A0A7C6AGL2_UNCW3
MIFNNRKNSWFVFLILIIISCPSPGTKEITLERIPETELLIEAGRTASTRPVYAFELLKKVDKPQYRIDKLKILLDIYLKQREYARASALLDSLQDGPKIKDDSLLKRLCCRVFIEQKNWQKILEFADDPILKGIALYNLQRYKEAIGYLPRDTELKDYCLIYLSRCYYKLNDFQNALNIALEIDSVSPALSYDFQNLLFDLVLNSTDISGLKKELSKIKDSAARKFLLLKIYERENDKINFKRLAFDLIKNNPSSPGAKYCITVLKPKDKTEYKLFGKVAFIHNDYQLATKFLSKGVKDSDVNYYLGKISYDQQQYNNALSYFRRSNRSEAYYYRALIYENRQDYRLAMIIYDSLINHHKDSRYATRALKRKAFLMEDIGDTLGAVATFVRVKEKSADFRAGFQLFRMGKLDKALEIFSHYKEPDFIYWQIKIKERLGEPVDSLRDYLTKNYPLSYYTLIKNKSSIIIDTTSIENWLRQFGDTTTTFDQEDSMRIKRAMRYFSLGEKNYAFAEIEAIEDKSFLDLIYLSKLCDENGYDYGAIKLCLELKKRFENNSDSKVYPLEFLRLLYPLRYIFSIMENSDDIWLTLAIIWQESNFNPDAKSRADARGLMQIIPGTGRLIASELGITDYSLYEPNTSIKFGTYYFKKMLSEFNFLALALAAYNAGPINLRKWLRKNSNAELDEFIELIPFSETRDYVRLTMVRQIIYKKIWEDIFD